ncbi:DUF6332 family protein [Streptomyces sp. L2]|uniref:DUF6332 family protein n=1 Tax=Streptomyces sp. L2 TaxID=2162665 RepID=UPI0010128988|nr:DUF6332 family protein [Streptomyces sp. L2]
MDEYGGRRRKAEQDAATVEIGYALLSAGFAAAVVFGAVAGPALLFALPHLLEAVLLRLGLALGAVLFAARVVSVLVRFRRAGGRAGPVS